MNSQGQPSDTKKLGKFFSCMGEDFVKLSEMIVTLHNAPEASTEESGQSTVKNGQSTMDSVQSAVASEKSTAENGTLTPKNGQSTPGNGTLTPKNGQSTPGNGTLTPKNGQSTPGNGQSTVESGQLTPDDGRGLPLGIEIPPQNHPREEIPAEVSPVLKNPEVVLPQWGPSNGFSPLKLPDITFRRLNAELESESEDEGMINIIDHEEIAP